MPWINNKTGEQQDLRPVRVRLADGSTRTNSEVTDQMLADAGWEWHFIPAKNPTVSISTGTEAGEVL